MNATKNSIKPIKIVNTTDPPATGIELKMKGKQSNDNTKICPAVMFANKRIASANGFVNIPIISTGIIKGFIHHGTGGFKM